jgi:16S rRNA (adenine1518-N6/adenine1519-N6)-dimethyltransferase
MTDRSAGDGLKAASEPGSPAVSSTTPRPPRLDALAVRRQLRDEGLRARHSLSQNFLADPDVLQSILDLAAPRPGSRILEIGPGLGILTGGLLAAGASVVAVELDRRLAERVGRTQAEAVDSGKLRVVQADILDEDVHAVIEPPYEVVANVPYHITSPILHRFLGSAPRPERLVLMLQREVAERITAEPGAMSYLSVFVQYHAAVRIAFTVPREAFEPAPEVESAVVEIRPLDPDGTAQFLDPTDEDDLWRLVQAGFRERRKKLRNVISRQLPVSGEDVHRALKAVGIDPDRRPQTLSVAEWLALRDAMGPLPGRPRTEAGRTGTGRPPSGRPPSGRTPAGRTPAGRKSPR